MTRPPALTDRDALRRNRARAREDALFLHEALADEVQERLKEVNRTFTAVSIITGQPTFWRDRFPGATVIEDDETLDLTPDSFDLVIHAFALHWADDPVGQLVQCRRALRPDGLLLAGFAGGQTLQELRIALSEAESAVTGGLSPRIAPMGEIRDLGGLLQRAGFALPVADAFKLIASYNNALHLMRDLRAMGEGNALASRLRRPTRRDVLTEAASVYSGHFSDETGRIPATFEIIMLTGWAPDESQPQPLRPGSATTRLADALGATDKPA